MRFTTHLCCLALVIGAMSARGEARLPNIVFFLADDLGYGDLGCYGQKHIRTPRIDQLADGGMRFTQHYAGNNVCAPSRCVLMTGMHPGHAIIRDNRQAPDFDEGQTPVPASSLTLPLTLQRLGYKVGGFGKWGLGPTGSSGGPLRQGFDRWYGYNCQAVAHNYYPSRLWDDETPMKLNNPSFSAHEQLPPDVDPNDADSYDRYQGKEYAPDLIADQARKFITQHRETPFFLYFPTTVPHLALQVPADSVAEYQDSFDDSPYAGDRRYLPNRTPRATYAAMITRLDREIGRIVDLVEEFGLSNDTIFVFTSDNGPLYDRLGGTDTEFFDSAGGLRGRKGSFYEGGFRVPCVVQWKGKIAPGQTSDRITGFEDWLPTLLELIGASNQIPREIDGISFASTLQGKEQPPRAFLYRESPGYGGQQAVRVGKWKGLRRELNKRGPTTTALELYDLSKDPAETRDVAGEHPDVVKELLSILDREHEPSPTFPIRKLDAGSNKSEG